ncbi:MAG: polyprenyl synthetase family protein [Bacteroidales bacterium]|nr:polyprenyl synthetase family protein [Bacteroidales bacterium]
MTDSRIIKETISKLFAEIQFEKSPEGLYDPLRYMISIGGKRIRPKLCLLTYSLYRDDFPQEILEPAAALEVFHTFTLIHDDIMDRSPLRRGQETVWKKWNEDTAILSGDVMQIDAYKRLAKAPADKVGAALDMFSKTAAEVCEGQQFDMEFENRAEVSMEEYSKMIGLKTAVLIACSAKMGALIAGAPEKDCEALYRYGYELGMAFQVADDYLDAFGDEKVFGKPIGGDIINKKKSWLTVRTLEKTADKKAFLEAMEFPAETLEEKAAKIAKVKAIYVANGVDNDAKNEIVRYSDRALEAVKDLGLPLDLLKDFAEKLVGRAK